MIREYEYAKGLAEHIWTKFYKIDSPEWEPLPDLLGVLTQIDNMVCKLERHQQADSSDSESLCGCFAPAVRIRCNDFLNGKCITRCR